MCVCVCECVSVRECECVCMRTDERVCAQVEHEERAVCVQQREDGSAPPSDTPHVCRSSALSQRSSLCTAHSAHVSRRVSSRPVQSSRVPLRAGGHVLERVGELERAAVLEQRVRVQRDAPQAAHGVQSRRPLAQRLLPRRPVSRHRLLLLICTGTCTKYNAREATARVTAVSA